MLIIAYNVNWDIRFTKINVHNRARLEPIQRTMFVTHVLADVLSVMKMVV